MVTLLSFYLTGKVDANTMLVMDSFALPVEGTETRVNAQAQAYEYMTAYIEAAKQVNMLISVVFHFLNGFHTFDNTEMLQQMNCKT